MESETSVSTDKCSDDSEEIDILVCTHNIWKKDKFDSDENCMLLLFM